MPPSRTPLTDVPRYAVGLYFLWASLTTLISRFFLNLRAVGNSERDWVTAGIYGSAGQTNVSFSFRKRQTHTTGSAPAIWAPTRDDVYTIGDNDDFEMH